MTFDLLRGSADYLGINHYTTKYVEPAVKSSKTIYPNDDGVLYSYDDNWPKTPTDWLRVRSLFFFIRYTHTEMNVLINFMFGTRLFLKDS